MACELADLAHVEQLLAALVTSSTTPSAIEFASGPAWNSTGRLIVGLEGSDEEVAWMCSTLAAEWNSLGVKEFQTFEGDAAPELWQELREFSTDRTAPLVIKASMRPSAVCSFVALIRKIDAKASILAHAGTGVVLVRFAEFSAGDISEHLIGKLQPAARHAAGQLVVLSSNGLGELTRQAQWGGVDAATEWMTKVKQQFDPKDVLNPGRFVFP